MIFLNYRINNGGLNIVGMPFMELHLIGTVVAMGSLNLMNYPPQMGTRVYIYNHYNYYYSSDANIFIQFILVKL